MTGKGIIHQVHVATLDVFSARGYTAGSCFPTGQDRPRRKRGANNLVPYAYRVFGTGYPKDNSRETPFEMTAIVAGNSLGLFSPSDDVISRYIGYRVGSWTMDLATLSGPAFGVAPNLENLNGHGEKDGFFEIIVLPK